MKSSYEISGRIKRDVLFWYIRKCGNHFIKDRHQYPNILWLPKRHFEKLAQRKADPQEKFRFDSLIFNDWFIIWTNHDPIICKTHAHNFYIKFDRITVTDDFFYKLLNYEQSINDNIDELINDCINEIISELYEVGISGFNCFMDKLDYSHFNKFSRALDIKKFISSNIKYELIKKKKELTKKLDSQITLIDKYLESNS